MGAYKGLSRYFKDGVINKANELGYGEFLISVLKGDIETLEQKYNSVWNNLKNNKHAMDGRTPIEYGRDIISSWAFEDCVIGVLNGDGLKLSYGKDYGSRKRFTSRPDKLDTDVTLNTGLHKYIITIMCDYTGLWSKDKVMALRPSQYKKLKNKPTIVLGFSTTDNKLVILNSSCAKGASYVKSYKPYGGKDAYTINIPESAVCTFSNTNMLKEIKNYYLYK